MKFRWTTRRIILKQLDYLLSISMRDNRLGIHPHQLSHSSINLQWSIVNLNLIGPFAVFHLLIDSSQWKSLFHTSVHVATSVWNLLIADGNTIKHFFLSITLNFYAMRPLQIYTKTIRLLTLVFYERSHLDCASLTICSKKNRARSLIVQ